MIGFCEYARRKVEDAQSAVLFPLVTTDDRSAALQVEALGNEWTTRLYGGPFHLPVDPGRDEPSVSLVFVQSPDGNTAGNDPEHFAGGPIDKHLIREGLSRVAADGVIAGATAIRGVEPFLSVWHPELIAFRRSLGLPRHPAQLIFTRSGDVDLDRFSMVGVPDVPVFILSSPDGCRRLEKRAARRSRIEFVPIEGGDVRAALRFLRAHRRIDRISAIGGCSSASALLDAGLVQDVCLTTAERQDGRSRISFYVGTTPPSLTPIVRKRASDPSCPARYEHLWVNR